ncbi:MAG: ribosomal protein [Alphaproteobacteria bacterium]|nr:ribosomal protein [Alphaproteobacteria bacterium]
MSRVGKHPVTIPTGVDAALNGQAVTVKGKLGQLSLDVRNDVSIEQKDGTLVVQPTNQDRYTLAQWATTRALLASMVKGVSEGFKKEMELRGVGYKAAVQGKDLVMSLGFSHEIRFPIPENITIQTPTATEVVVTGADKQRVGQVAANIRSYRPPEPYKGKGIRYKGEFIAMKEGKKK